MADISKIELPNGVTYNIKDEDARTNYVSKSNELLTTNSFAPNSLRGPYISKIDNAFYAADKRWTVTATNAVGNVSSLFDGSYETALNIRDGKTCVITLDFSNTTYFPGYPYGYILVSFYYVTKPTSINGRVYCNYSSQGIGWHDISFSPMSDNESSKITYRSAHQSYYSISKLEITIVGDTTNSYGYTGVSQIEMHLDRPDSSRNPFLSKYSAETLYYNLTAPKFIGAVEGNVTGNVSGTASNVTGTVAVANGGTGKTTGRDAANYFMNALDTGSSTPVDADYYISQYVNGGTTTTTYHRRPMTALWNYIKSKFSGTSPITFSNGVIGINTASTSGYGATKLSTSTSSTATDLAATPSAVKTAYDLANTANGTANTALSGVNGTLIYDHTYSISNGVATFTAHVYQKGVEVTSNYADSCFGWSYRLSNNVTGTPSIVSLGTGKTKTITISTLGYGGHVIGTFTDS